MFSSKLDNSKINSIHKRTLRCIYKKDNSTLDYLTEKYQEPSFHERIIQLYKSMSMLFIYRIINNLSPEMLVEFFQVKKKLLFITIKMNSPVAKIMLSKFKLVL